jgi:hypothetical protein
MPIVAFAGVHDVGDVLLLDVPGRGVRHDVGFYLQAVELLMTPGWRALISSANRPPVYVC